MPPRNKPNIANVSVLEPHLLIIIDPFILPFFFKSYMQLYTIFELVYFSIANDVTTLLGYCTKGKCTCKGLCCIARC